LDAHASGFRECIDEISRYLISIEGFDIQHPLRLRLLSHLECFTERSVSPSSSHHSWPLIHQQTPSAFATPPLSSYPSPTMGYHHQTNPNFNIHHYQQRPLIDSSCQLQPPSCI
jgi:YRPW motif-containing protein